MQVNAAVLFASFQGLFTHASLADHSAQAKVANHLPLVRLFPDGSRRSRSHTSPLAFVIFDHNRPAVVQDSTFEIDTRGKLSAVVEVLVDGIPSGEQDPG